MRTSLPLALLILLLVAAAAPPAAGQQRRPAAASSRQLIPARNPTTSCVTMDVFSDFADLMREQLSKYCKEGTKDIVQFIKGQTDEIKKEITSGSGGNQGSLWQYGNGGVGGGGSSPMNLQLELGILQTQLSTLVTKTDAINAKMMALAPATAARYLMETIDTLPNIETMKNLVQICSHASTLKNISNAISNLASQKLVEETKEEVVDSILGLKKEVYQLKSPLAELATQNDIYMLSENMTSLAYESDIEYLIDILNKLPSQKYFDELSNSINKHTDEKVTLSEKSLVETKSNIQEVRNQIDTLSITLARITLQIDNLTELSSMNDFNDQVLTLASKTDVDNIVDIINTLLMKELSTKDNNPTDCQNKLDRITSEINDLVTVSDLVKIIEEAINNLTSDSSGLVFNNEEPRAEKSTHHGKSNHHKEHIYLNIILALNVVILVLFLFTIWKIQHQQQHHYCYHTHPELRRDTAQLMAPLTKQSAHYKSCSLPYGGVKGSTEVLGPYTEDNKAL